MKKITLAILSLILSSLYTFAQDSVQVLNIQSFEPDYIFDKQINLTKLTGWVFKTGNNLNWANPNLNTSNWQLLSPSELSVKNADKTGRVEGWFRLKIRLDSSFSHIPIAFYKNSWAAVDLYIDGRKVGVFGNTGANGKPYVEHYPNFKPALPIQLVPQQNHVIALHFVDYVSPFSEKYLKSELDNGTKWLLQLISSEDIEIWNYYNKQNYLIYVTIWTTTSLILTILFWLLSFQNLYEQKIIRLLAIWGTMSTLATLGDFLLSFEFPFMIEVIIFRLSYLLYIISYSFLTIPSLLILGYPLSSRFNGFFIATWIFSGISRVFFGIEWFMNLITIVQILFFLFCLIRSWKKLKGAQWSIVVGILFTFFIALFFTITVLTGNKFNYSLLISGVILPLPLSFLAYIALRFKEILAEVKEKAEAVLQVTQEKNELLANQNETLEKQVEARTAELKASQNQLIQKEKLASLGELTAGIAHEIQNPLNFVNNFSEMSVELIQEIKSPLTPEGGIRDGEKMDMELIEDVVQNLSKINHHGKRASSIVSGMLEHSRSSTGERQLTDINKLADEYLRLSYHGMRAKDSSFSADYEFIADENLPSVNVVPQDIGRVLLNLMNNAFYAVSKKEGGKVIVSTKASDNAIEIKVADNGTGMSEEVKAKIFQPFFTTKPTGEGTGLGLSLAYDIVTKGHGGTIEVESVEGQGTTFVVKLPA